MFSVIFKDKANRDWTLSLNIGTAMLVKDKLGIDLLQPETGDPPLLTRLGTDEMLLAQVIATLLEGQFAKYNVDANEIYQSFDGTTFVKAHEAFYKELIDFFQSRGAARPGESGRETEKYDSGRRAVLFFSARDKNRQHQYRRSHQAGYAERVGDQRESVFCNVVRQHQLR